MHAEPRARSGVHDLRPHPRASTPALRALERLPTDEAIARLAAGQAGLVARWQLTALGLGRGAIGHRLAQGRLRRRRHGVHAVGHAAGAARVDQWDAVLAVGPAAVLRGRTAAELWGLLPRPAEVEVLAPASRAHRPGLRMRTTAWLPGPHVAVRHGLPVTSIPRTLLDLAADATPRELERAHDAAEVAGRLNRAAVEAVLRGAGRRHGVSALRALLARDAPHCTLTESELEEMLLLRMRAAGLPEPRTQFWIGRYRVDFCWPALRVVAEADGLSTHGRRHALQMDRRRLTDLTNAGWTVLAFVWDDVADDPDYVVGALATGLARATDRLSRRTGPPAPDALRPRPRAGG